MGQIKIYGLKDNLNSIKFSRWQIPHSIWNNIENKTVMIGISVKSKNN